MEYEEEAPLTPAGAVGWRVWLEVTTALGLVVAVALLECWRVVAVELAELVTTTEDVLKVEETVLVRVTVMGSEVALCSRAKPAAGALLEVAAADDLVEVR